jgi:acetylglutamate kinase
VTATTDSDAGQAAPHALAKAATLIEALPWLERFHGKIVVIKFGGHAMTDEALCFAFAQDVVFLRYAGLRPVVVHGGGPQITEHLGRLGIQSTFAGGLRVTTPETMDVVRMVLTGQVNRDMVGQINRHGPYAVGMSGEDANLLTASRATGVTVNGAPVDLGQVGEIRAVDPGAVRALIADGRIPVISSVARGEPGQVYNVNADTAAAAVAVALGAAKLVLLTDVAGLYADWPRNAKGAPPPPRQRAAVPRCTEEQGSLRPSDETNAAPPSGPEAQRKHSGPEAQKGTVISRLDAGELAAMLPGLDGGMIPKMEACLTAVRGGVPQAHVIDGRLPHAILLEIFTNSGIGTMVVPEEDAS